MFQSSSKGTRPYFDRAEASHSAGVELGSIASATVPVKPFASVAPRREEH
jgi:hypothetical protein